jgi:CRISPR/Cas system CSM-associated protein Csm3 (group 7 of RAMP superfamily)
MIQLSKMIERTCPSKLLNIQVVMLGSKFKVKITHPLKSEPSFWWKWKKLLRAILEKLLIEQSSQYQPISMILNVKLLKTQDKYQA